MVLTLTIMTGLLAVWLTSRWGTGLGEWLTVAKARVIGSAVGSLIMVLYRPGHDTRKHLAVRVAIGFVVGFITAPVILYWIEMPETMDSMLFAGTVGGSLGVIIIQTLHSRWFQTYLRGRLNK
jgi:hypothetical protein